MNTAFRSLSTLLLSTAAALAACRSSDREASRTWRDTTARSDTAGGVARMQGMQGMQGMSTGMMDSMQIHMRMMDTVSADRMKAMLPMHRQMAANMLLRMGSDMRGMNMTGDEAWTATVESLRQDLARMPEMTGAELKTMMPAHRERMTRLMQMHRNMMGR